MHINMDYYSFEVNTSNQLLTYYHKDEIEWRDSSGKEVTFSQKIV